VYVIDFGLSRRFRNKDGSIKEPRSYAGFRGTARYASLNSHQSTELSRRDDLWSLFYLMVEFLTGSLPWKKEKEREQIGKMKEEFTNPALVQGLPQQMLSLLHHINQLTFRESPNYAFIRGLFQQMLAQTRERPAAFFKSAGAQVPLAYSKFLNEPAAGLTEETVSAEVPLLSGLNHKENSEESSEGGSDDMNDPRAGGSKLQQQQHHHHHHHHHQAQPMFQRHEQHLPPHHPPGYDGCEICQTSAQRHLQGLSQATDQGLLRWGSTSASQALQAEKVVLPPITFLPGFHSQPPPRASHHLGARSSSSTTSTMSASTLPISPSVSTTFRTEQSQTSSFAGGEMPASQSARPTLQLSSPVPSAPLHLARGPAAWGAPPTSPTSSNSPTAMVFKRKRTARRLADAVSRTQTAVYSSRNNSEEERVFSSHFDSDLQTSMHQLAKRPRLTFSEFVPSSFFSS